MNLFKSKLVKSLGIYTISNVINSAIPFLLLPLLTQNLATDDYGVLTNYNSLISIIIPFVSFNLMSSLQVIYIKNRPGFASYISSGLLTILALTLFFSALFYFNASNLAKLTGVPEELVIFTTFYATYQNIVEILLSIWRMEEKAWGYGVFRIVRTIVELSIATVLIISFNLSFEGSIYALAYSYGIGAIVAIFFMYRQGLLVWDFQWKHVKHLVTYGAPLIPHVLGSTLIMYTDKLVITKYEGLSSNGIYSVGFMVGQAIGLLQNSFNQAWVPYVFKGLKSGNEVVKQKIVKWTYIYFIAIILVTVVFYLCTPIIFSFLGKAYQDGIALVLWISLGFAFNGMYKMVSVYFFYTEKTNYIAIISIFTAVVNVFFVFWMVPKYGYTGAAIATMTAFFIQFLLTWAWSLRIVSMPWGNWKIWKN
ncbi:oligosaccharide flippase family protein [Fluviicola taffensis]|jgi:O-antigen/teichoic acid export membrane protein|uniref:Polysaccharide biosynthesis protein n=1 Tax=Fluviicola taffensis (strain DSM 16823 / NCIMB 13979 / RW262) TaxID=755732 RepID=F2IA06_FLUTR|nr:oligosaccharide flippase family protein [Fluviicola taffensis]AEA44164.1 polysaccharide biosynthesis protein [Fluviicola taffensis DSM 16823]